MSGAGAGIVAARWPAVAVWLAAPGPALSIGRTEGTPVATLVADGIQLAGAYDPAAEAALQAELVPPDARRATCYGIGQGELPRALLAREALAALDVVLFHPGLARAVFAGADPTDWLADPRLTLSLARDHAELAPPFAAAPADLRLAERDAIRLADLVRLELATPHIRRHLRAGEEEIARRLAANRDLVAADGDVAELFGTARGASILVAAPGPSLADHYGMLRERGGRPLIAVDAALQPCLAAGVRPDVAVAVDPHRHGPEFLLAASAAATAGITLVYDPVVPRAALERWAGRRLAMYASGPRHEALRRILPRGELWSSGSVLHPAVALAVAMGAAEVVLCGADFAILGGASHVAGFAWRKELAARPGGATVENGFGERVPSLPNLVGYLRDLERFLARHPGVRWINASRRGARIAGTRYPEEVHGR
ncbi:MAG: 6-hydroxymethylpterin diphosphokinase MptE-like protein [Planctomycetota bacterium]